MLIIEKDPLARREVDFRSASVLSRGSPMSRFARVVNQNLNSHTGFNGIIRKIYYLMLVGSIYLLPVVIPSIEYAGDEAANA